MTGGATAGFVPTGFVPAGFVPTGFVPTGFVPVGAVPPVTGIVGDATVGEALASASPASSSLTSSSSSMLIVGGSSVESAGTEAVGVGSGPRVVADSGSVGVATCEAGVCGYACLAGLGDCNGQESDGCEQDLLASELHCGECGRSCLGGQCVDGGCSVEELVAGLTRPFGIVLDSSRVYWTDSEDNSVYSVDKAGGAKQTLAVGGATGPITISGSTLYWATGLAIDRIKTTGADQQAVVGGESLIADLANDGTNLYWLRTGTWSGSTYNNDGSVVRVALTGGTAVPLTTNSQKRPKALAVDATHVYWVNEGTYTGLSYNMDGAVLRVGKTGGVTTWIAANQDKPCGIAVNDTSVYWANCGSGVVMMADKGSTPQELLAGQSISEGLRLDGKELFWPYLGPNPNVATGDVRKASVSSTSVLVLAAQQHQPFRVAVDSTHVYWLNLGAPPFGNGGLFRVAR